MRIIVVTNVRALFPSKMSSVLAGDNMSPRSVFFSFSSAINAHCTKIATRLKVMLMTKTVMEASLIVMLPFFFFSFLPMLLPLQDRFAIIGVLEYLPNVLLIDVAHQVEDGANFGAVGLELGLLTAWALAAFVGSVVMYNRKQTD